MKEQPIHLEEPHTQDNDLHDHHTNAVDRWDYSISENTTEGQPEVITGTTDIPIIVEYSTAQNNQRQSTNSEIEHSSQDIGPPSLQRQPQENNHGELQV